MSGPRYTAVGRPREGTERLIDRYLRDLPNCPVCDALIDVLSRRAGYLAEEHGRISGVRVNGVAQTERCPGSGTVMPRYRKAVRALRTEAA